MAEEKPAAGAQSKAEPKSTDNPASPPKKFNMVFFGAVGGILAISFIAMFVLVSLTRPKSAEEKDAERLADSLEAVSGHGASETEELSTTAEEPIEAVVNIAGTGAQRYLKVACSFGFRGEAEGPLAEVLKKMHPKHTAMLVEQLSKLTLAEIMEPDAQATIRAHMQRSVNESLSPDIGQIADVYITEFLIQ